MFMDKLTWVVGYGNGCEKTVVADTWETTGGILVLKDRTVDGQTVEPVRAIFRDWAYCVRGAEVV